ncbi:TPA: methionyl-tRNA formyltransferase [Vibrio vulnificus]|nr:methionyl-tRNA formyltransferase [Vibrio vulnificus]
MYIANSNVIKIFATGLKGLKVVQGIKEKTEKIVVVIGKDINIINDYSEEILDFCKINNIQYTYDSLDNDLDFGLAIAAGWQKMIYDIPSDALIVFHDSLLPKYRGFNPLVTALLNQDDYIGLTALTAGEKYDCGNIIYQVKIPISYPVLIRDAINKVACSYYDVAKIIYELSIGNKLKGIPQDESKATYSLWRDEEDYLIDWSSSSDEIYLKINSLGYPYLGASSFVNNEIVRIKRSTVVNDVVIENRTPGKIIFFSDGKPVVVCGRGLLRLDSIESNHGEELTITKLRTRFK